MKDCSNILPYFVFLLLPLLVMSCKKDEKCSAGTGGNVTLVLEPEHHTDPIYSQPNYPDSAFIAFDKTEFPGDDPTKYDLIIVGQSGSKQVSVSGLKCGKYYIYVTGYDTSANSRVIGGIPLEFSDEEGIKSIKIPVTEG